MLKILCKPWMFVISLIDYCWYSVESSIFCKILMIGTLATNISTSIVGTDIRMSNLNIRLSNLNIHMSKLILAFGKIKTAKNSEILVAFRTFFQIFNTLYGWKIRASYVKMHSQVGHTFVQVGHTYVQPEYIGWTYVCPTLLVYS